MTVDCVDWSLNVNLANHPIGITEKRDGEQKIVIPQVRRLIYTTISWSLICRKKRMMLPERKVLRESMLASGGGQMIMENPPAGSGATPRTPAT